MSDSDSDPISPVTSTESESDDIVAQYERLSQQRRFVFQTKSLITHSLPEYKALFAKLRDSIDDLNEPTDFVAGLLANAEQRVKGLLASRDDRIGSLEARILELERERDELVAMGKEEAEAYRRQYELEYSGKSEELVRLKEQLDGACVKVAEAEEEANKWRSQFDVAMQSVKVILESLISNESLGQVKDKLDGLQLGLLGDWAGNNIAQVLQWRNKMEQELASVNDALLAKESRERQLETEREKMSVKYSESVKELNGFQKNLSAQYKEELESATARQYLLEQTVSKREIAVKELQVHLEQTEERSRFHEERVKTQEAIIQSLQGEKEAVERKLVESQTNLVKIQSELKLVSEDARENLVALKTQLSEAQMQAEEEKAKLALEMEKGLKAAEERVQTAVSQLSVQIEDSESEKKEQVTALREEICDYQKKLSGLHSELSSAQKLREMTSENVIQHQQSIEKLELELLEGLEKQRQMEEEIERRTETIRHLEKDLVATKMSSHEFRTQAMELSQQSNQKESTFKSEREQLLLELEKHKEKLLEIQTQTSELESQHAVCKDEIEHREKIVEQLNSQYEQSEAEFVGCKVKIEELEEALKTTRENERASQKQIYDAECLIQQLKDDLEEVRVERDQSRIALLESHTNLTRLEEDKKELEGQHSLCLDRMAEQEKMAEKLKNGSRVLENKYEVVYGEVEQRLETIRQLEQELEARKQKERNLQDECIRLQGDVQTWRGQLKLAQEEYQMAEKKFVEEQQKRAALEKDGDSLRKSIKEMREEKALLTADLESVRESLTTKDSEAEMSSHFVAKLTKQVESLKSENESFKTELDELRAENEVLSLKLEERVQKSESDREEIFRKDSEQTMFKLKVTSLEEQFKRILGEVKSKDASIERLKKELEEKCAVCRDLQSTAKRFENDVWSAEEKWKSAEQNVERCNLVIASLENDLVKSKEAVATANDHTLEVKREMAEREVAFTTEKEELRKELSNQRDKAAQVQLELTTLQQQHSYCKEEIEHREAAVGDLELKYQQAQEEFFTCKAVVDELNEKLQTAHEEKDAAEIHMSKFELVVENLREKASHLEEENQASRVEFEVSTDEIARLKIDRKSLEDEKRVILEKLAYQNEVIGNLEQSRDVMEKKYELSVGELREHVDVISRLQIDIARFKEQEKSVDHKLTSLKEQCNELEEELASTKRRLEETVIERTESEKEFKIKLAAVESEHQTVLQSKQSLQKKIEKYESDHEIRRIDEQLLEQLRLHLEALQTLNESLRKELENDHRKIEMLSADLREAREQISTDRQEIATKDGELVVLRVASRAAKEECEHLNDEIGSKDGTLSRVRLQIDELSAEKRDLQLTAHQLQQNFLSVQEKLRASQQELKSVADLVLNKPSDVQPAPGGMAANIITWIKRLKRSMTVLKEENDLKNRQIGLNLREEISKLEASLQREKRLVEQLRLELEDQFELRRQQELQLANKSVTIERLQEQLSSHMQTVQHLTNQVDAVSKVNVEQRIQLDKEKTTRRLLESENKRKEALISEWDRITPDSGHDSTEDADASSRSEGLYAAALKRGLLLKRVSKPDLDQSTAGDGGFMDPSYWIGKSTKLSFQLQQSSLFYSQEDRRQALQLEEFHQEKLSSSSTNESSNSMPSEASVNGESES